MELYNKHKGINRRNLLLAGSALLMENLLCGFSGRKFINNENGTITDLERKIMWTSNANIALNKIPEVHSYYEAQELISKFDYAGYNNWRIPVFEDWASILDTKRKNPALKEEFRKYVKNYNCNFPYWISDINLCLRKNKSENKESEAIEIKGFYTKEELRKILEQEFNKLINPSEKSFYDKLPEVCLLTHEGIVRLNKAEITTQRKEELGWVWPVRYIK